jgi:uncharacterized protein with GYD domain
MPLYLYQASYTPQSLAIQIKDPEDRLEVVNRQISSTGAKLLSGGFSFGEHDVTVIIDAPDDVTMAAIAIAIAAAGAVSDAQTTRLLSGAEYVEALKKAAGVGYKPAD